MPTAVVWTLNFLVGIRSLDHRCVRHRLGARTKAQYRLPCILAGPESSGLVFGTSWAPKLLGSFTMLRRYRNLAGTKYAQSYCSCCQLFVVPARAQRVLLDLKNRSRGGDGFDRMYVTNVR